MSRSGRTINYALDFLLGKATLVVRDRDLRRGAERQHLREQTNPKRRTHTLLVFPVVLSVSKTFRMPSASISKVTST